MKKIVLETSPGTSARTHKQTKMDADPETRKEIDVNSQLFTEPEPLPRLDFNHTDEQLDNYLIHARERGLLDSPRFYRRSESKPMPPIPHFIPAWLYTQPKQEVSVYSITRRTSDLLLDDLTSLMDSRKAHRHHRCQIRNLVRIDDAHWKLTNFVKKIDDDDMMPPLEVAREVWVDPPAGNQCSDYAILSVSSTAGENTIVTAVEAFPMAGLRGRFSVFQPAKHKIRALGFRCFQCGQCFAIDGDPVTEAQARERMSHHHHRDKLGRLLCDRCSSPRKSSPCAGPVQKRICWESTATAEEKDVV